jgi:hypothetical protein
MNPTCGWDIGGVNTKVARVAEGLVLAVRSRPYELQRDPLRLVSLLRELAADVGTEEGDVHAVTMTAELSQMFRTKRDGVRFVLDAVEAAFPSSVVAVFGVGGSFLSPGDARDRPLAVAAANWAATARIVARDHPDALLVDIGTTSTDLIPIVAGAVVAAGRTDPARLASGELVYTGAVRTPAEAMAADVPFGAARAGVSAEGFALAGDVHVWRGDLHPIEYTWPTPDGRPATREFAGERLARAICADREMLDERDITDIADALASAQVDRIAGAIGRVIARHRSITTAVVTGLGMFIGDRAARQAGLQVFALSSSLGEAAARCAPAAAVALLYESVNSHASNSQLRTTPLPTTQRPTVPHSPSRSASLVETVVKIGGGLLEHGGCLDRVLAVVRDIASERSVLIVPGGGPFADAVRIQDERLALTDEAAHWMAVLAMDQYAHVIASRLPSAAIVSDPAEMTTALRVGHVPVLAPSAWLRRADPLPHSWDVTSDSIAAWVAGEIGARQLVLVKPPHAGGDSIVDAYFARAVLPGISTEIIPADEIDRLRVATPR